MAASGTILRYCQRVLQFMVEGKGFDTAMKNMQVTAASPGKIVCEMAVEESHLNRNGGMHGGLTATLVDQVSTLALLTEEGHLPGVSVDLNVSYLKGAKAGDVLEIRSECLKYGKSLAFATVDILKKNDGALIAVGRQTKHVSTVYIEKQ